MEPLIGQADAQAGAAAIIDGSDATFRQDVMEPSQTTPVIVDFWAPWCGPCKQLGPALEKAVTAAGGKVRLVKINIDESPMIAQQLQVQSIPAVFGFVGGRPVDGFAGAQPDSAIRDFIARLLKAAGNDDSQDPIEAALEQADAAIEAGDFAMAAGIFGQVLEHDPENFKVAAKLAQAYIKLGEVEAAKAILAEIPVAKSQDPDVLSAHAALELADKAAEAQTQLADLEAKLAADPKDHQARLDLAEAQAAVGQSEEAVDNLLHIIQVNKDWNDGAARLQLLKVFEALGPMDPVVQSGRRRLSSLLFS